MTVAAWASPPLGHLAGRGGALSDLLFVAVPLLVVGLLLTRDSRRAAVSLVAVGLVCGALGGYDVWRTRPRSSTGVTLQVISPRSGDSVPAGQPIEVKVQVTGLRLTPVSTAVNRPGEGHLHTYVDGSLYAMWSQVGDDDLLRLPPGPHKVRIEVTANDHRPLSPPVDDILDLISR